MGFGFIIIPIPILGKNRRFEAKGHFLNCERCHATSFSLCDKGHYACNSCGTKVEIHEMEKRAEKNVIFQRENVNVFKGFTIFGIIASVLSVFRFWPAEFVIVPFTIFSAIFSRKRRNERKKAQAFYESVTAARRALQEELDGKSDMGETYTPAFSVPDQTKE